MTPTAPARKAAEEIIDLFAYLPGAQVPNLETVAEAVQAAITESEADLIEAAKSALHYMRLHKYADQAWADDVEAALRKRGIEI